MKRIISVLTVFLILNVNGQKSITIDGGVAWFYECDTLVKAEKCLDLMREKSFHKTSIMVGDNHMVFDLVNGTFTNDIIKSGMHWEYCLENIKIEKDTISFYYDELSRGEEKIPYRMHMTIILNTKLESDIVWIASYARKDLHNLVEGQFVKKSMCTVKVE